MPDSSYSQPFPAAPAPTPSRLPLILGAIALFSVLVALLILLSPPRTFPTGARITVPPGATVLESAKLLADAGAVHSATALQMVILAQFGDGGVKAGIYQFDTPLGTIAVARALVGGTHGVPLVRVTIPEGLRNAQIDAIVSERIPTITAGEFETYAAGQEGYLFPETYHVPEEYTAEALVALMAETFREELDELAPTIAASGHSEEDIVIMASILEREANSPESMGLVSGILWNRMDAGMRLQVDASFAYLLDKTSEEVTLDDLAIDSPYNTYRYAGLPPTPIANPGRAALEAAAHPTPSPYLFYLTAPNGTFHYAETFAEHEENIERYLTD